MNSNVDLETWRLLWQAEPEQPVVAELRDRVTRETRRRKAALATPIIVTIVIGGWVAARAIASARFEDVALAVETWLFIAVIWAGSLWIDRGTWRPLGDTTSAFLDISIRRCQSALTAVRFGVYLYLIQLLVVVSWKVHYAAVEPVSLLRSWPIMLLEWFGVPAMLTFYVWYTRRKTTELGRLVHLREQFQRD